MEIIDEILQKIEVLEKENEDLKASIKCIAEDRNKVFDLLTFIMNGLPRTEEILSYPDDEFKNIFIKWANDHDVQVPRICLINKYKKELEFITQEEYVKRKKEASDE